MKKISLPALPVGSIITASCTSTKITNSWREPDKAVVVDTLNKVLVAASFKDETSRDKAEEQVAGYLDGKGIVSYDYLESFDKKNKDAIRKKIKKNGFDTAVIMRLMDVDKEKIYTSSNTFFYPSYYRNFISYYYRSCSYFSNIAYYATTKTYRV